MGHTLMENRCGLIVNAVVTQADGYAEREAAKAMVSDAWQVNPEATITLWADKGYDTADFNHENRIRISSRTCRTFDDLFWARLDGQLNMRHPAHPIG